MAYDRCQGLNIISLAPAEEQLNYYRLLIIPDLLISVLLATLIEWKFYQLGKIPILLI
jgi:hypothetical protein